MDLRIFAKAKLPVGEGFANQQPMFEFYMEILCVDVDIEELH